MLSLLFLHVLLAASSALEAHLIGDRWLFIRSASAEFAKDSGAFVFLLETSESAIDRLVILNYNTNHYFVFPPFREFIFEKSYLR